MVLGEDASLESPESQTAQDSGDSHDPETLFILDSIVQRLKPRDAHHVRDMITERGRTSGALFLSSALWWWITISKGSEQVDDSLIPVSTLGSLDFETVSIIIPGIMLHGGDFQNGYHTLHYKLHVKGKRLFKLKNAEPQNRYHALNFKFP